jgi:hypothetical protein
MRRVIGLLGLAGVLGALPAATVIAAPIVLASVSPQVDNSLFFEDLAPYGEWINHADYGWVWSPNVDSEDWRPYTLGHWSWTDEYGWLWVSDEEFGWAVYHYGRWLDDEEYAWIWVPGYEWGPAWVSWREGEGYIGWAALPPRVRWDDEEGFGTRYDDLDEYIPRDHYCYVRDRMFVEVRLSTYILPTSRAESCYRSTRNHTDYHWYHGRIFNRSIDVDHVRVVTGHAVPRVRTVEVQSAAAWHGQHGRNAHTPGAAYL